MAHERPKTRVATTSDDLQLSASLSQLRQPTFTYTRSMEGGRTISAVSLPSPASSIGASSSFGWLRSASTSTSASSVVPGANDKVIVLMGQTGSGKSTFINYASGSKVAAATEGATSCTDAIQMYHCVHPSKPHEQFYLVDTPGFDHTKAKSPRRVLQQVSDWLIESYKREVKIAGILQLVDISQARVTGSHRAALRIFSELCGSDFMPNIVVVSTCWGDLENPQLGETRQSHLRNLLADDRVLNGIRYASFKERTREAAWHVIDLLQGPGRVLCIQSEVVDQRKPLEESSAFRSLRRFWNLLR